jgi:hypothetical protein
MIKCAAEECPSRYVAQGAYSIYVQQDLALGALKGSLSAGWAASYAIFSGFKNRHL